MKSIHYNNPKVASYLLLGGIFFISGFSNGFALFFLGAMLILAGIKVNNQLS